MNNIAIVGSSGYIAGYLRKAFDNTGSKCQIVNYDIVENTGVKHLDLANLSDFIFDDFNKIDYLIFTAAISSPDLCSKDYDYCWNINVIGTDRVITEALKRNIHVLFFSSDAVYSGCSEYICNESTVTVSRTPYGDMKKNIEDKFKDDRNFKSIRLSYVVSSEDRFVSYCIKCIKENTLAEIYHPFYRNCISVTDVADTVLWFQKHWDKFSSPFLNLAGIELVSRLRIADEINRYFNGQLRYEIVSPKEDFYTNRPAITQMESEYQNLHIFRQESFTKKMEHELKGISL